MRLFSPDLFRKRMKRGIVFWVIKLLWQKGFAEFFRFCSNCVLRLRPFNAPVPRLVGSVARIETSSFTFLEANLLEAVASRLLRPSPLFSGKSGIYQLSWSVVRRLSLPKVP